MPKIVAVLDDLYFTVKIMDAAKRAGVEAVFVKDEARALQLAQELPALILFDLNTQAVNAVDLIQKIKQAPETRHVPVLGFVSHVQTERIDRAKAAGADLVMPRSTFSRNLPAILARHAEAPGPEA